MSALPPKADICGALAHVRFVRIAAICRPPPLSGGYLFCTKAYAQTVTYFVFLFSQLESQFCRSLRRSRKRDQPYPRVREVRGSG
jgi:hypothetical protein